MERNARRKKIETVSDQERVNPAMAFVAIVETGIVPVEEDISEPWDKRGLCRQVDPTIFFPEKGGSAEKAKRICGECKVRNPCLERALAQSNYHDHGIWGGTTERERQKIRKARSQQRQSEDAA